MEESTLAQLSPKDHRSDIFAWYTLIGTFGASIGNIVCGWLVEKLHALHGWTKVDAYRVVFMLYAGLGVLKFLLSFLLSKSCESAPVKPDKGKARRRETLPDNGAVVGADGSPAELDDPERPLLSSPPSSPDFRSAGWAPQGNQPLRGLRSLLPALSPESRRILIKLALLFSLDSFGSGLVPVSWLAVYFTTRHALTAGLLGTLFSVTSLVAATSNIASASIARRIGLLKTMVFTHLPSSAFLALIPFVEQRWLAVLLLVLRSCTSTMDTAPRSAFIAAAVLDAERTAVMGVVNVVKTLSQSAGPAVTGELAGRGLFWVAFVVAGSVKIVYDLGIGASFWAFRGRDEEDEESA